MRISAEPGDPDYRPGLINARVYLDGSLLNHVVEADEDAGSARVISFDDAGNVLVEGDEFKTELLRGVVKIVISDIRAEGRAEG